MNPPESAPTEVLLEEGRIVWRLRGEPPFSVEVRSGSQTIRLLAEADTGGGIAIWVETTSPVALEIETEMTTFVEMVPAGRTRYLLTYLDRTDVRQV